MTTTSHSPTMRSISSLRQEALGRILSKTRELFPDTVVEVDSSFQCGDYVMLNGSLRQRRLRPIINPRAFEFQFPCEAHRSCVLRTEESLIGQITTMKTNLGGSVWLPCSQSGSNTKKVVTLFSSCVGRCSYENTIKSRSS